MMTEVGRLFNKVPYEVRDNECAYTPIYHVEEVINDFLNNYMMTIDDLMSVSSNNRDTITNLHIVINGLMPKDSISIDYKHDSFDISFEEYKELKTKSKNITSLMFIEKFKQNKELELVEIFEAIIGCDGQRLFISLAQDKFNIYNPSSKLYSYRRILISKKNILKDIAKNFDIKYDKLYKDLNPNIIKKVCKDLSLTYKNLALEIGYKPDTINKAASSAKISEQLQKAVEMYLENLRLKEELSDFVNLKQILKNILT